MFLLMFAPHSIRSSGTLTPFGITNTLSSELPRKQLEQTVALPLLVALYHNNRSHSRGWHNKIPYALSLLVFCCGRRRNLDYRGEDSVPRGVYLVRMVHGSIFEEFSCLRLPVHPGLWDIGLVVILGRQVVRRLVL